VALPGVGRVSALLGAIDTSGCTLLS
jgi:hypothetical protein